MPQRPLLVRPPQAPPTELPKTPAPDSWWERALAIVGGVTGLPVLNPDDYSTPEGQQTARTWTENADLVGMLPLGALGGLGMAAATGGRKLTKATQEAMSLSSLGGKRIPNPIKAYHGSPHDFEKFSLSKIGTGEGAQAYGHGLYFAEQPSTAAYYKKAGLTDPRDAMNQIIDSAKTYKGDDMQLRGVIASDLFRHPALQKWGDSPEIVNHLVNIVRGQEAAGTVTPAALRSYQTIDRMLGELPKGKMYEVNIHATPDELLDWDKPLSQQSEKVRQAAEASFGDARPVKVRDGWYSVTRVGPDGSGRTMTSDIMESTPEAAMQRFSEWRDSGAGSNFYRTLGDETRGPNSLSGPTVASAKLRDAGIKGIQYLDQGSRASGTGTKNFVIFDDELIEIARKYGIPVAVLQAAYAEHLKQKDRPRSLGSLGGR